MTLVDQAKDFPSASIAIGKSGQGKTVLSRERLEYYVSQGFCRIALYDWGRFETPFMNFPNPYRYMWDLYCENNRRFFHIDIEADYGAKYSPHGFKTLCYVPFTEDMPSRLPSCFRPFRLSFESLSLEEFCVLLGDLTRTSRDLIEIAWAEKSKKMTFHEFVELVITYASQGKISIFIRDEEITSNIGDMRGFASLVRSLHSLYRLGLICDRDDEYALDLDAIMRDKSVTHCFSMAFMENVENAFLIYAYLIRKIRDLRLKDPSRYPNLFMVVNEAHELCPSEIDHAGQTESLYYMKLLLSQPRDIKLWAFLDTQRFKRLDVTIRSSPYTYYVFQSDMREIEELDERFKLADSVKASIKKLPVGVYCIIMDRVDVPVFSAPPLSMCKEHSDDFFKWWRYYGLPYRSYRFSVPEKIFTIRKPRVEESMSAKERSLVDNQLFVFHRYALEILEREKRPVSIKDYCKLWGKTPEHFSKYLSPHPLFKHFFSVEQVKGHKYQFTPIPRGPEAYSLRSAPVSNGDVVPPASGESVAAPV